MEMSAARRWTLLVTVAAGLLLITLDNSILYTALPTLTREIGASSSAGLWIINAYPLVMAGLLLGAGTLGDRVGHRRMFLIGLVVFGAGSLVAAFAPSPVVLIAARAVLGAGAAAMMPATLALIRITFTDERERNVAIAVWGSMAVLGSALGPIVGGILLAHFWWGSVFLVNIPVVAVALVATVLVAPAGDVDRSKRWDFVSSLQVMVGLVGLVMAIKELAMSSPSPVVVVVAVVAAAAGFWTFARRQRRLPYPLLEFSIFRNRAFASGVLAAGISLFAIAGVELATTQRFQLVVGFTPLQAGLLVAAVALGSLPTALIGGAILHRVGLFPLICGGLAVSAVGVVWAMLTVHAGIGWFVAGLIVIGAGLGGVMSVASTAIIGNAPVHRAGMASSIEEVSYEFGSLTAVALLGSLLTGIYSTVVRLPEGAPVAAGEGVATAVSLAGTGNQANTALLDAAFTAFDTGYVVVLSVVAVVLVIGTAVTGVLLRRYRPRTAISISASH